MTTVGFIGLGTMGRPIASHILERLPKGDTLVINDRSAERVSQLLADGAVWADNARELGERADLVFFMVPDVPQVWAVLEGPDGLLAGAGENNVLLVVCSTVAPDAVRQLDDQVSRATDGRIRVIDAPVSGGQVGAEAGTLSIMVGGPDELVAQAMPYLSSAGNPVHLGPTGAGEVAKACNQMLMVAAIQAVAEALHLSRAAGVAPAGVRQALAGGSAGSRVLDVMGGRMVDRDFVAGVEARLHHKDYAIVIGEAHRLGVPLPVSTQVGQQLNALMAMGWGQNDTATLLRVLEAMEGAV